MVGSGCRAILQSFAELFTQRPTQAMSLNWLVPTRAMVDTYRDQTTKVYDLGTR
jgi:hypothetical protein